MLPKQVNYVALTVCLLSSASHASQIKVPFISTLVTNNNVAASPSSAISNNNNPAAPATNAKLKIVLPVQAGDGQTFNDVLVDTGSAILWVGGQTAYVPGPDTRATNDTFSVGYGIGGVSGTAYYDRVTIGSASVSSQIIGSAESTNGFVLVEPIDGILGLGPSGSNGDEVSGFNTTPTFVENLVSEGTIEHPIFGVYVSSLNQDGVPQGTGEITFGGVDQSRIQGDITWVPQNPPLNLHWEFNASSLSWGSTQLISEPTFARTDSGVLTLDIPFDSFFSILDAVPGSTIDSNSALEGALVFPANMSAESLPPITIGIADLTFTIPASQYLVPTSLYSALNITDNLVHSFISSAGPGAFDLGQIFLESAYTAYDMENHFGSKNPISTLSIVWLVCPAGDEGGHLFPRQKFYGKFTAAKIHQIKLQSTHLIFRSTWAVNISKQ